MRTEQYYKVIHSDLRGHLEVLASSLAMVEDNLRAQGLTFNTFKQEEEGTL
jgi:hypothetical protein